MITLPTRKHALSSPPKQNFYTFRGTKELNLRRMTLKQTSLAQDTLKEEAYPSLQAFTSLVHGTGHERLKIALQVWHPPQGEHESKMNPDMKCWK